MTTTETELKLTAAELDNVIRLMLQEVAWMQQDLERAAACSFVELKQGTIQTLIPPSLRRMTLQLEFVKRNGGDA